MSQSDRNQNSDVVSLPRFDLEKYSRLSREKRFTLEVVVQTPFKIYHIRDGESPLLSLNQVLHIGTPIPNSGGYQVAASSGEFLFHARGADLQRCVRPTEKTTNVVERTEDRQSQNFWHHSLVHVVRKITCRSLAGHPIELLPITTLYAGSSKLLPNHELLATPTITNATPSTYFVVPRSTYHDLLAHGFLVLAGGLDASPGEYHRDLTSRDDEDRETYVACEDFIGCTPGCDSMPVENNEEVEVFCKTRDSTRKFFWCRNKAGETFVHDPMTPSQVSLIKATPQGTSNYLLLARQQGLNDWSKVKVKDYYEAVAAAHAKEEPHPLTWDGDKECRGCGHFFERHGDFCLFKDVDKSMQREHAFDF